MSTDGTWEQLAEIRRQDDLFVRGDGSLFRCGGMRAAIAAYEKAVQPPDPDEYFLFLNDDVKLRTGAIKILIEYLDCDGADIAVGRCSDPATGRSTYGGYVGRSRLRPLTLVAVDGEEHADIEFMNGNIVMMRRDVYHSVGGLSKRFTHGLGDFDFSLRCRRAGYRVRLLGPALGECARNSVNGTWRDPGASAATRLRHLVSPKGIPPREWSYFCLRHFGALGIPYLFSPWIIALRPPRLYDPY
jgi:GT2 family glycosyltransferase